MFDDGQLRVGMKVFFSHLDFHLLTGHKKGTTKMRSKTKNYQPIITT